MRWVFAVFLLSACGQDAGNGREAPPVVEPPAPDPATEAAEPPVTAEPVAEASPEPQEAPQEPSDAERFAGPEGETPQQAVERCRGLATEGNTEFERCLIATLDEVEVRARERQLLIEAHETLRNEERVLDHMEAFLDDYPRDRRGNGYRIRLRQSGRL